MKKILFSFLFFIALCSAAQAQEGIYPTVRVKDSLRLTNIRAAFFGSTWKSPQLRFGSFVWDTINNVSRWSEWNVYNEGVQGNATVKSYLRFVNKATGITNILMQPDGTTNFGNGFAFTLNSTMFSGGNTINFQSNSSTFKFNFSNVTGAMSSNGVLAKFASVGENGNKAKIVEVVGNAYLPVLNVWGENTISSGTNNPSFQAQIEAASTGKGVLIPRMNTAQMLGIPKRVATVTLTNPGAGFTQFAPRAILNSPVGGLPARVYVVGSFGPAGGTVTGLALYYGGSGFYSNGAILFDTSGTNATAMPAGTYTVTTDTIAESMLVYNTDSLCFFFYRNSSNSWISLCNSGGGGGGVGSPTDTSHLSARINNAYTSIEKIDDTTWIHCKPSGICDTVTITQGENTFIIDLALGDYTILQPGIYKIQNASPGSILFEDAALMDGESITLINIDTSTGATFDNSNSPIDSAGNTLTAQAKGSATIYKSIDGHWYNIK